MLKQLLQKIGLTSSPTTTKATTPAAAPAPVAIVPVTDDNFTEIVLASPTLAVVDFWAEWCQPCQITAAYMEFLAKDYGDQILLAALDVDENPQTPERYTVMGLPTLVLFHAGQEVDRIVGVTEYQAIQARVEPWLARSI
ncbi:MAG: thiol reductase thioredoxin [Caldilineaceae bacterium]|nr:thiol reductase thioredoxin [Caldilineaceae bacterium]